MSWALRDEPIETWPRPNGLNQAAVCALSGLAPNGRCPTVAEYFIAGTEPRVIDNMYQEFRVNRETGRLATLGTPPELIDTKVYIVYPDEAADWVRENEIEQAPTEFDTIVTPGIAVGGAAVLSPQPFDFIHGQVVISGTAKAENFAYYRLAYYDGLTPGALHVIADQVTEQKEMAALGAWDVSGLDGLRTLVLTVVKQDGTFDEVSVPLTVDNVPPLAALLFPLPGQAIFTDEDWVIVQAQVSDDNSVARVEFYADGAQVPFAISTVPPFTEKWPIPGPGCHAFSVRVWDAAGNDSLSPAVSACAVVR
jgi:hypothetical protein